MAIYTLCPLNDPRWEDLLQVHPSATVFHSRQWLLALQQTYGYDPVVVTTCPPHAELTNGLVLCRVRSLFGRKRLVSVPFSDHCAPLAGDELEMEHLLESVAAYCRQLGEAYLEIRPLRVLPIPHLGFGPVSAFYIHQLAISDQLDEIFSHFSRGSVQRKILKAEHANLRYEEGRSSELISEFYRLLLLTRRRHQIPPQPIEWFQTLAKCLGEAFKVRVAFKEGRPIASIVTLQSARTMVYKYGCSDDAHWNLGGIQLLLWKAIQESALAGCGNFDFGRSDLEHKGLISFKERWGAKRRLLSYWTTPPVGEPGRGVLDSSLARRAFSFVPDQMLVLFGRVMYRYIA